MRLVDEPDLRGHVGEGLSAEDPVARDFEPTPKHVRVRRDAEGVRESAGQMGRTGAELGRGRRHRHRLEQAGIEVGTEALGVLAGHARRNHLGRIAERCPDPLRERPQSRLGLEPVVRARKPIMEQLDGRRRPGSGITGRSTAGPISRSPSTLVSR